MLPRPGVSRPGWNSSDNSVHGADKQFCRAASDYPAGSVPEPALQLLPGFAWASANRHGVNGPWLLLRPLTNFSREIVLADSELFVYVNQLLPGVLKEKAPSQQKECREQIAEEQHGIQGNCPSIIVKDCLPVRIQEVEAVHQQKTKGHEESQREE